MMMRRLLLGGLLVLPGLMVAHAADQTVRGSALIVKNPSAAANRKITVKAKETASDDTLVGDPVTNGATVTVTVNGASPSLETYTLPAGASWSGDTVKGFKYSDSKGVNGPVKNAQIKLKGGTFQIKVGIVGKLGSVAIVPPDPG